LEALAEKAEAGALIVVEGQRDVKALRRLGVEGSFFCIKACGSSLEERIRSLEAEGRAREILVLTDFDRGGVKLALETARRLEARGLHPNLEFWVKLRGLMGRQVKDVEGLASYLENVKRKLPPLIS